MPHDLEIDDVRDVVARDGAQLIEVLPSEEYEEEHLERAINIPLKTLDESSVAQLNRDAPVIVYCHDYQ